MPRLTRCPWQPKDRVKQNSSYASHMVEKTQFALGDTVVLQTKKCQKNLHMLYST